METMRITVQSVVKKEGFYRARARATAQDTMISIEVTMVDNEASDADEGEA